MNILVTGGAGYIGSHTCKELIRRGHRVVIFDNLGRGHRWAARDIPVIVGDLLDYDALLDALHGHEIEAVVHFAALALVGESCANPALYYRNNVVGSLNLLQAMVDCKVPKIVFSSTAATYGVPKTDLIREDHPQLPINPYGWTKLVVEQMLHDFNQAHGLRTAALRYFNAAGADPAGLIGEDHDPETHLIPNVLRVALGEDNNLVIHGEDYPTPDGTCIRDYIHVADLATAHCLALEWLEANEHGAFNLGTGSGNSVREVLEACRQATGHPIPVKVGPRRAGDPPKLVADSGRAQSQLGWTPTHSSIQEIVSTAWRWHQAHQGAPA
jgi:UDP-glucose-4-epimerase GalE